MRRNVRVVVAALVILALGSGSVLLGRSEAGNGSGSKQKAAKSTRSAEDNPFGPFGGGFGEGPAANPFGGLSKTRRTSRKTPKCDNPFGDASKRPAKRVLKPRGRLSPAVKQNSILVFPMIHSARIERALDEKTKMNFADHTLSEIVQFLKVTHHIPACLDLKALEKLDIGSDHQVTYAADGITLRHALEFMLKEHELAYTIRNDMLVISTAEAIAKEESIRVYDVADLVTYRDRDRGSCTDYEPLIDLLVTTIDAKSWAGQGGSGHIVGHDFSTAKILVVSQSYSVYRKIDALLTAIRAVAAKTPGEAPLREPAGKPRRHGGII
jgi:hypothetical protein